MALPRPVLALVLLTLSAPALAQTTIAETAEEEIVCVGVGRIWSGDAEEIRRISADPVPASYRALFFQGGCGSGLIHESLIDWHLAFGTEASAAAALDFLERAYLADAAAPAAFPQALARAWRVAQRDLDAAAPLLARPDPESRTGLRQLNANPRVGRLRALIRAHDRLIFLALQSLRVAELHGSSTALARARSYHQAAEAGMALLYEGTPPPAGGPGTNLYNALALDESATGQFRDAGMRIAILTARLTREPANIDAAARILDANYSPVLRLAADNAERWKDFCDNGSGDALDPVREACDNENDFLRRFTRFWRNQVQLDLLMGADPVNYRPRPPAPPSATSGSAFVRAEPGADAAFSQPFPDTFDFAVNIFERGRLESILNGAVYGGSDEDLVALYVARAERDARLAQRVAVSGRQDERESGFLGDALKALARAERLVHPARNPVRFRLIAERFLALVASYEAAWLRETEGRSGPDRRFVGQAAYFVQVLAGLDRIVVGGAPQ